MDKIEKRISGILSLKTSNIVSSLKNVFYNFIGADNEQIEAIENSALIENSLEITTNENDFWLHLVTSGAKCKPELAPPKPGVW